MSHLPFRPDLLDFKPYSSARTEAGQAQVYLDANELSLGSPVAHPGLELNRYPDPLQPELKRAIGARLGLGPDSIFTGVGSDEVIDLLIRLFCTPGKDEALTFAPTYGVYEVASRIGFVKFRKAALDRDFGLDLAVAKDAIRPETKLVFLCSPNNPTGNLLDTSKILELCRSFSGIVAVDQAYVEFSGPGEKHLLAELEQNPNLVLIRTFSKAWGLAGIRLGYCLANPEVISFLNKIKPPYNLNLLSVRAALDALANPGFVRSSIAQIQSERSRVSSSLAHIPGVAQVYPSDSNFILFRLKDRDRAYSALQAQGILLRKRSEPGLENCLRMTIGTPSQNDAVLAVLQEAAR